MVMEGFDIGGLEREAKRHRIAYHEAGHAVAMWAFRIPLLDEVVGEPEAHAVRGLHEESLCKRIGQWGAHRAAAIVLLAGEAAQNRWQPETLANGCEQDRVDARHHAEAMASLDKRTLRHDYLTELENEARRLVEDHWHRIDVLATTLLRHPRIAGNVVEAIIDSIVGPLRSRTSVH
jgi:hypothetical protein